MQIAHGVIVQQVIIIVKVKEPTEILRDSIIKPILNGKDIRATAKTLKTLSVQLVRFYAGRNCIDPQQIILRQV